MATNARGEWHRHHIQSLYLGIITATAVAFTLGIPSRLERVFFALRMRIQITSNQSL